MRGFLGLVDHIIGLTCAQRACPGKRMADGSMFIEIAMLAAAFNIGKAQDEDGRILNLTACINLVS